MKLLQDEGIPFEKVALGEIAKRGGLTIITEAIKNSCDEYLSCMLIRITNHNMFKGLKTALNNQFLLKKDAYPLTLLEALKFLKNYCVPTNGRFGKLGSNSAVSTGLAFVQAAVAPVGEPNKYAEVSCFGCGKKGHLLWKFKSTSHEKKKEIYASKRAEHRVAKCEYWR